MGVGYPGPQARQAEGNYILNKSLKVETIFEFQTYNPFLPFCLEDAALPGGAPLVLDLRFILSGSPRKTNKARGSWLPYNMCDNDLAPYINNFTVITRISRYAPAYITMCTCPINTCHFCFADREELFIEKLSMRFLIFISLVNLQFVFIF